MTDEKFFVMANKNELTGSYISLQPCSPMISIAFRNSPAFIYISAADFGSFTLLAQSACFANSIFFSETSSAPTNSCETEKSSQTQQVTQNVIVRDRPPPLGEQLSNIWNQYPIKIKQESQQEMDTPHSNHTKILTVNVKSSKQCHDSSENEKLQQPVHQLHGSWG